MQENGYIKFDCKWEKTPPVIPGDIFQKLNPWRNNLYDLNLIGVYKTGIGYGNISVRINETNSFFISGSATGAIKETGTEHYSFVESFNLNENLVNCTGPVKASSESLTHGAIYASAPRIAGIIHIHHQGMWEWALDRFPTSGKEWAFGTPEIAIEISRLLRDPEISANGIIVMGGHESGLLFFGSDIDVAGKLTLDTFKQFIDE